MPRKERRTGIYCIENSKNGKKYIGKGLDIDARWTNHRYLLRNNKHYNIHLQRAYNLYGEDIFSFYIIELCDKDELNGREIYYIQKYDTMNLNMGYNESEGGVGPSGYTQTEETRKKISIASSGEKNGMYGKTHTPEARKKQSEARKQRGGVRFGPHSEATRRKIGEKNKGRLKGIVRSEETRKKMSKPKSKEFCENLGKIKRAKKMKRGYGEYVGTSFRKSSKRWLSRIRLNGKETYLGSFSTELEAALAYDEASWNFFKNLDYLNFPENYEGEKRE